MNQATHAWLATEAYRKIAALSRTDEGKKKKLDGLERLLGENLKDVVVASWLPDSLINDKVYGHVFKNSMYKEDQIDRFTLTKKDLAKCLRKDNVASKVAFDLVPDSWWSKAYRVKANGGHLPARVNSLCQTSRDMLKMGDGDIEGMTGVKSKGSEIISKAFLFSPRDVAITLWMTSHYIADAHMPFHCDNRALASTAKQKTHSDVEDLWGKQVPDLFHSQKILRTSSETILDALPTSNSKFREIDFGSKVSSMKNGGDPWKEAVYICRASFAVSFALIPPTVSEVDDQQKKVSLNDILQNGFCGEDRFWNVSRAIMADAVNSIAMFWQDIWVDFTTKE